MGWGVDRLDAALQTLARRVTALALAEGETPDGLQFETLRVRLS